MVDPEPVQTALPAPKPYQPQPSSLLTAPAPSRSPEDGAGVARAYPFDVPLHIRLHPNEFLSPS